jgi:hypothetical protein
MHAMLIPLLFNVFATSVEVFPIHIRVGETLDARKFPTQNPTFESWLATINPWMIGQHTQSLVIDNATVTYQLNISLKDTIVAEPFSTLPFIASFQVGNPGFVELYNPTLNDLPLVGYALILDDTSYRFTETLSLPSQTSIKIPMQIGTPQIGSIDESHPIIVTELPTALHLWEAERFIYIDSIAITTTMNTRFAAVTLSDHIFYRESFIISPESTYTASSWYALDASIPWQSFAPLPPLTPLLQAKAWATDVMFGAGMFAAGRVEEAFRALEREYGFMNLASQLLLFEEPNTQITGINERGNLDRSTFREAVGRYNYLAARVPGANGLINPNPSPFPLNTLILISLGLVGLFGIFAFIKSRYQRV